MRGSRGLELGLDDDMSCGGFDGVYLFCGNPSIGVFRIFSSGYSLKTWRDTQSVWN